MTLLEPLPALSVDQGLDFLLGHSKEPVWPRKISSKTTKDRQVLVHTKDEALARFKQANYLDCKINAYRWREDWAIQLLSQAPENIFAEQDEQDFKLAKAFELAVRRTLRNFEKKLDGASPTVINSGNGVHFIQPVDGPIL